MIVTFVQERGSGEGGVKYANNNNIIMYANYSAIKPLYIMTMQNHG